MKFVGVKQVLKSVKEEKIKKVYVADDVQSHITAELISLCQEKHIEVIHVATKAELGKMAGIEVDASCTAE